MIYTYADGCFMLAANCQQLEKWPLYIISGKVARIDPYLLNQGSSYFGNGWIEVDQPTMDDDIPCSIIPS